MTSLLMAGVIPDTLTISNASQPYWSDRSFSYEIQGPVSI